jgi:hypothetical protein
MKNRWLDRYNYSPSGARGNGFSRGARVNAGHPEAGSEGDLRAPSAVSGPTTNEPRRSPGGITATLHVLNPFLTIAASLATLAVALVSFNILRSHHDYYPSPSTASKDGRLPAIKVERAQNAQAAQHLVETRALSAQRLFHRWNRNGSVGGSARRIHGPAPRGEQKKVWYVPVPRERWEPQFDDLQDGGFTSLQFHEIHIPQGWTAENIENHEFRWAGMCRVSKEWIDMWSSFRSAASNRELRNECVPGGICLVISDGDCDARTFEDMESIMSASSQE